MCGIVCAFEIKQKAEDLRPQILEMSKTLRHRGPDWSGIFADKNSILAHERLAIVDPTSGKQPIFSKDKSLVLAANGEIYNHKALRSEVEDYEFTTNSDCEIILALYKKYGNAFIDKLNGIFGFALYDANSNHFLIARDHMGIIPLYVGRDEHGTLYVASELKALEGICTKIESFPPGHFLSNDSEDFQQWYKPSWRNFEDVKNNETSIEILMDVL